MRDLGEILPLKSFLRGSIWTLRDPDRHPVTEPPDIRILNTVWGPEEELPEHVTFERLLDSRDFTSRIGPASGDSAAWFVETYRPVPPRTRYERILDGMALCCGDA